MPYINYEDYPNKRIYLHLDTVSLTSLDLVHIYREHITRRSVNANGERNFERMVLMLGNDPAGGSTTPKYVDLQQDVRLVPFDTSHSPLISPTALISRAENLAGRDLFDRDSLTAGVEVDIDYQPEKTGFTKVSTGSGVEPSDIVAIAAAVGVILSNSDIATETKQDLVKAKTDNLTFSSNGNVNSNVKEINDNGGLIGDGDSTPISKA